MDQSFPKSEHLCGKAAVAAVFERGKTVQAGCLRCKFLHQPQEGPSRVLVSVPKRHFKRAVKRNLLKRRIREAYRRQKCSDGLDLILVYVAQEVLPYETLYTDMATLLQAVSAREMQSSENQKDI